MKHIPSGKTRKTNHRLSILSLIVFLSGALRFGIDDVVREEKENDLNFFFFHLTLYDIRARVFVVSFFFRRERNLTPVCDNPTGVPSSSSPIK
jgi:hypothetical protein